MKQRCAHILPLTPSLQSNPHDNHKVLVVDPFTFLALCHPTKGVPRETPIFQFVNNIFVVTKKRNTGHRLIERWGLTSATTVLTTVTQRTRTASLVKPQEKIFAGGGQTQGPVTSSCRPPPVEELHRPATLETAPPSYNDRLPLITTATAPPPPITSTTTGSSRELLVYWDIESLTPRNFVAQYKALLRLLSLHDLYDKWSTHVQLHVYFDGGGWGQTSTFASFSDVATLVQGLLDAVQTILHPIPTGRGGAKPSAAAFAANGQPSATTDAIFADIINTLRRAHDNKRSPTSETISSDTVPVSHAEPHLTRTRDSTVVVALLTCHAPHTLLDATLSPSWGGAVEGVVYCAGDSPPTATLQFLHTLQQRRSHGAAATTCRTLYLSADVVRFSFATLSLGMVGLPSNKAVAQPAKAVLPIESATRRRYVLTGPVPLERPAEITIAEVTLLGASTMTLMDGVDVEPAHPLANKPYGWLLLPMLYCLWQLQQERGSVDILLRDVFQVIRKTVIRPPSSGHAPAAAKGNSSVAETEVLYSAFHALVSQGWLTPGYGKHFEGRHFPSAVCWTCFTSNMPKEIEEPVSEMQGSRSSSRTQHHSLTPSRFSFHNDTTSHEGGMSPAWALAASTKSPRMSSTPLPPPARLSFAWSQSTPALDGAGEGDDLLLLINDELQKNHDGQLGDVLDKATPGSLRPASIHTTSPFGDDPFGSQQLRLPPLLRDSSTPSTMAAGLTSSQSEDTRSVCVPLSNLLSSTLYMFPMACICVLGRHRQWMPAELIAAQQEHRVDLLRVLVPLLTLQRQHGTRNVSEAALTDRCVVLEQMVMSMQGGMSSPYGAAPPPNVSYVSRLAALSGSPALARSTTGSRLDREKFVQEIDLAVSARVLARLEDGTLTFVSDVHLSSATTSVHDLEHAKLIVDDNADSHRYRRSPPELSHVFTLQSLPRLLLIRALRDEQFVVYPMFSVRLRNVRQRWHELCSRHGLSLAVTAWDHARAQLERARMIYVFTAPQAPHLTSMMFWSDAIAIAMTTASSMNHQQSLQSTVTLLTDSHVVAQRVEEPYFCSNLVDAHRLCCRNAADGHKPLELSRDVFAREVQLLPRELSFAALQDSLNEQLLVILHALQKMQRAVVVDAVVCEYLVARFILQSPSGPGLMDHNNYQHTSPTAPSAPTRVSSVMARHELSNVANVQSSIWSRLREAQHQLASYRLIYISGADIAFGSDYIYHIPHWASLRKTPRANLLEHDAVELQHDAAILDLGVKVFLETLMHMQRLLRRVRVPWGSLCRILEQHLSTSDGPLDVLDRCENAGLLHVEFVSQQSPGVSSAAHHQRDRQWNQQPPAYHHPSSGAPMQQGTPHSVCFASDAPTSSSSYVAVTNGGAAIAPGVGGSLDVNVAPPAYQQPPPPLPPPLSKPLNPYCKPFVLETQQTSSSPPHQDSVGDVAGQPQLLTSVEMLKDLTAPAPPSPSRPLASRSIVNATTGDEVVPLSSLSHRRRVVQKKGGALGPGNSSVLSQLFLTLERLEGKGGGGVGGGDDDPTSDGTNSVRGATPAIRDSTPAPPATPTSATAPGGSSSSGGGASSRFISALTWLFESALEDVSHGPKHHTKATDAANNKDPSQATDDENSRRRKLYYSTLAAFFDTAANNRESNVDGGVASSVLDDEDDDDDLLWDPSPSQKRRQENERSSASRSGGGDDASANPTTASAGWHDGGIVVPSRNRPQLSSEQKRSIRQLHARLTQTALLEGRQDAEPWESVSFFFARAEVMAGLSL
ncbi:GPI-anchored surface protein, putative [Bodo saltans]|uniref:GPI-anchored surface protein, putative n=1 Tax=Bodo saltans TaxID=75058 RepID=A0A0S4IJJ4_BODSA|nr:GPI-anchored surface protein, putative [Bodo saltans]|eukprot:CUE87571.1 GPI-anchored surface protein, putative [Bodo saltans]